MVGMLLQGAHDIQSYCLGHTSFVTCAAFLSSPAGTVLVSGAGDGTIRYFHVIAYPAAPQSCSGWWLPALALLCATRGVLLNDRHGSEF